MCQHDFEIANQGFPSFRSELNSGLQALASNSAGTTEPATTYAYQMWYDETNDILKIRNSDDDAWIDIATFDQTGDVVSVFSGLEIGVDVQAYDADTAKTDVDQTFTGAQRGTVTTDNDLSFDMDVTNNFKATPTGTGTLTFTNITAGQSGNIYLDNSGGHVISAAATTYISAADLTTISTAGVYWVSYFSDGTNVLCSVTPALTASGA